MTENASGLLIGLLLWAGGTQPLVASASAPAFELRRGVLLDAARGAVYLGDAARGVEAVDLATGRSLWRTSAAALPLALQDRLLLAQVEEPQPASRLPLVLLDASDRGRTLLESRVPLPDGVPALVADDVSRSFKVVARFLQGAFVVSWSYRETPASGLAPPPGEQPAEQRLQGVARLDPGSGRVEPAEAPPPEPRPKLPEPVERLLEGKALPHHPWRAGAVLAIVEGGRGGRLSLKRWHARTGKPLPTLTLLEAGVASLPSADERHILASELAGSGGPHDPAYRWSIFALETGERIGQARRDVAAAPFFVWKDRLIYVSQPNGVRDGEGKWIAEPLKLRAVQLAGGEALWDRALRDQEYRGDRPPAR